MPTQRIETPDGISWHVESLTPTISTPQPEVIVFIPSGEGDACATIAPAALLASKGYYALTFDMPGFSRTHAPLSAYEHPVTPQLLATQILGLLDALLRLLIRRLAVLALCALYPERVKCGIVHEVPLARPPTFSEWQKLPDTEIADLCRDLFATRFVEAQGGGQLEWGNLGSEYHARLEKNFPIWLRGCSGIEKIGGELAADPENLKRRPLFWTVGALNQGAQEGMWKSNFDMAKEAGIQIETDRLQCLHFPGVTVPEQLAEWVNDCVQKVMVLPRDI